MINSTELRKLLGVSASQLRTLIGRGLPWQPHHSDARRKQFDPRAVKQWLIEHEFVEPDAHEPILGTRVEASKYFGVAVRTVAEWLNDPTFPGRAGRPGRRDGYFPVWQIEAWLGDKRPNIATGDDDELTTAARRARHQRTISEAELKAIDVAERKRQVADVEAMRRLYIQTHSLAKQTFAQVWPRVRDLLPAMPAEKVDQIQDAVEQSLQQTSATFRDGLRALDLMMGVKEEDDSPPPSSSQSP